MMRMIAVAVMLAVSGQGSRAQSHSIDLGEARIHYVVRGEGPAVVLIHGWALNLREWDDQIAALAPHYRVVAYDRRGYGKSTGDADISADPGDLRLLLDSLGIRSAVLVGHSAGGDVARRFALAHPERTAALVLYPLGGVPRGFVLPPELAPAVADTRRDIARQHGLDSVMRRVGSRPEFRPSPRRRPEIRARLDTIVRSYNGRDLLDPRPPSGRYVAPDVNQMRQWRFPVLFLLGDNEAALQHFVADSLATWMPNARKVVIDGGGHGVHFDEPERFNAALLEFVREVAARRPLP